MKKMIMIAALAALVLSTGTALAAREVRVTPITGPATTIYPGLEASGANPACEFGNLNPISFAITGWILGMEKYKTLFTADPTGCSICTEGFNVTSVSLSMQFGIEDVPVTFDARVDFEEAIWDENLACFVPGATICESSVYTVTIDAPGLYNIALPLDAACVCAEFGFTYGIGFEFLTAFASAPDLITDAFPVGCTSYNDYGSGWVDLATFVFPGETSMKAEIDCCNNPVATEGSTWGSIKSMFR